jgi:hypothetical protein
VAVVTVGVKLAPAIQNAQGDVQKFGALQGLGLVQRVSGKTPVRLPAGSSRPTTAALHPRAQRRRT